MIELINKITQEKVWCQWDLDGAKSFIKECIPDLPDYIIKNIIFGNGMLIPSGAGSVEYSDKHNPNGLNYKELLDVKLQFIEESCFDWSKSLYTIVSHFRKYISFEYYDYIFDQDIKTELEEIEKSFENTLNSIENLIIEIEKVQHVCTELKLEVDFDFYYYISTLEKVKHCILNKESDPKTKLDLHLQRELELASLKSIAPIDQYCDAGWISPSGDYYGLNGDIANLLHIKISNLLVENNIIEKTDNPDNFLTMHGWIKQHNDNLYCFYMYEDSPYYITKNQRQTIYNILKQRYDSINLCASFKTTPIKLEDFKKMDTYDFEKYFD